MVHETGLVEFKVGVMPDVVQITKSGHKPLTRQAIEAIIADNTNRLDAFAQSFSGNNG
jgi:hypothetical protein